MLGPFFYAPSADEKGIKVAWTVAWPALAMGAVITLLPDHEAATFYRGDACSPERLEGGGRLTEF